MDVSVFNYELEIGWFDKRNAKLAKMHETGSKKVPKRSHFYKILNSVHFWEYMNTKHGKELLQDNPKKGLEEFAELFIRYYKEFVLSGKVKPVLKASTILAKKEKGSLYPNIPLIDTAEMLNAIGYKIHGS